MRRWRERYEEHGFDGLLDRRRGRPSEKRVPLATVEQVLGLYRERYFDLNVRHFHEKLAEEHGIGLSYTWVKQALQGAGLVARGRKRGVHRKRRARRPLPGMLLHIDGSRHRWFQDERWHDLIVILDDATSEIYYAQLVEEESTLTVMAALREVVERKGLFCALYSDRGSHFWLTPKAGGKVDPHRLTQVGRALRELGIQMIPAYSPQARGRSERSFGTWQGRLPQELRLRGITTAGGGQPLSARALHRRVQPPLPGARRAARAPRLCRCPRQDLDLRLLAAVRARREPRQHRQLPESQPADRAGALARHAGRLHRDGAPASGRNLSLSYGPHRLGRYTAQGASLIRAQAQPANAVEKTRGGKVQKPTFPPRLEIPPSARDSHFPTASTTTGEFSNRTPHVLRKPDICTC